MSTIKLTLTRIGGARRALKGRKDRSAWDKGVTQYALNLLDELEERIREGYISKEETNRKLVEKALLNGADSWHQYSWGGCALIYDSDIAETLCNPSELKKRMGGGFATQRRRGMVGRTGKGFAPSGKPLDFSPFQCLI